jgi:hypothetical protein
MAGADRSVVEGTSEIFRLLHLALLNRDIKASSIFAISTVMTEAEIERMANVLLEVLGEFRPAINAVIGTRQRS